MIKKICYIAISCIIGCLFIGCSEADDVANNVLSEVVGTSENENVLAVKNGSPEAYPDITYGVAFKKYFGSPKWEYFKGVKEAVDSEGFIGLYKGGFKACAVGVSTALLWGYIASLIFKPKVKS